MLKGKHIVLGITGGIAAYKSVLLLRLLKKEGCDVQVVITPNGKEFITPVTLSSLSGNPVISEFFTANTGEWHSHVDLGLWADAMVVAPATASSLAKMANGVADNMLITTYLSAKCPVFLAPAMDLDMMAHPSTVSNIERLRSYGNIIIEAAEGHLASNLSGKGRMREPDEIVRVLKDYFVARERQDLAWYKGKKVLITAGPTYEPIDPVRFIGNHSTGKMGYALADAAAAAGAEVLVVAGPVSAKATHPSVRTQSVMTAREMLAATREHAQDADVVIFTAAVADYAPAVVEQQKIKREKVETAEIRLVRNPDIAATIASEKRDGQVMVGFALETDNESENAMKKLHNKHLDAIVLNSLRNAGAGFGTDTNKVDIFNKDGHVADIALKSKADIAYDILAVVIPNR